MIILLFLVAFMTFFLFYSYQTQVKSYQYAELNKLQGISRTLGHLIDGDAHDAMMQQFKQKDEIVTVAQDDFYWQTFELLRSTKVNNQLKSDIYTLVYNKELDCFEFAVSSSEEPYFRHRWNEYHEENIRLFNEGGTIGPYTDENGTWLSSFSPITNSAGETIAIVQTDEQFNTFISKARSKIYTYMLIVSAALILICIFMFLAVKRILRKEDLLKQRILNQTRVIERKNKDIVDSLNSAKKIQDAMLPSVERIRTIFPELFVLFHPRDIVSGDFFWFAEKDERVFFAVADCTGHGVPGAFMSMIGHTILNEVVNKDSCQTPACLLNALDHELGNALNKEGYKSAEGMDIAMCCYHMNTGELEFSGAFRPLLRVRGEEALKISGNKFAIGGRRILNKEFTNHKVDVRPGDKIYLYSDGYYDQFGGERGKKYLSKRFRNFILQLQDLKLEDQLYVLRYEFHLWKGNEDQIDDVLVSGFEIPQCTL